MSQKRSISIRTFLYCILIAISVAKGVYTQSSNPTLIYKAALKYFRTDTALSNNLGIPLNKLRFAVHPLTIKTAYQNTLSDKLLFSPKADSIEKNLARLDERFNKDFKSKKIYLRNSLGKANYTIFFSAVQDNMLYAELRRGEETDANYRMGVVFCYRIYLIDNKISEVIKGNLHQN